MPAAGSHSIGRRLTRGKLRTMPTHPFDHAIALAPGPDGSALGATSPAYWNMIGPYGGITAAIAVNAVMRHPALLGEPLALTINYAAPIAAGAFRARTRPARTNRSTQHWLVELVQDDGAGGESLTTTASIVTASRRDTFTDSEVPMPVVPRAEAVPRVDRSASGVAWLAAYEMRPVAGDMPRRWDGQFADSTSQLWMRDHPPRPLDFPALAAFADQFFPRVWLRRAIRVPAGTVSMTVYFHADSAALAATGSGYLLGQARGQGFRHGYFDHSGQLWNEAGLLLATTHQVVYFKG